MPSTADGLSMLLFSTSLLITYLAARLSLVRQPLLWPGAILINTPCFFLYALARQLPVADAFFAGVLLGVVFSGFSIVFGVYFKGLSATSRDQDRTVILAERRRA